LYSPVRPGGCEGSNPSLVTEFWSCFLWLPLARGTATFDKLDNRKVIA
jgi:hypothetical protein